jgi:hypothetical protein
MMLLLYAREWHSGTEQIPIYWQRIWGHTRSSAGASSAAQKLSSEPPRESFSRIRSLGGATVGTAKGLFAVFEDYGGIFLAKAVRYTRNTVCGVWKQTFEQHSTPQAMAISVAGSQLFLRTQ